MPLKILKLLQRDTIPYLMNVESVSTATLYEGPSDAVAETIEERLNVIYKLNPWLDGRLVRTGDGEISIQYELVSSKQPKVIAPQAFFQSH
jgi:hypothetical protein